LSQAGEKMQWKNEKFENVEQLNQAREVMAGKYNLKQTVSLECAGLTAL
jgi:hypothetical protein